MIRKVIGIQQDRLVWNDLGGLNPTAGGQHDFGRRIINPLGQFGRGETAKHNRMDRANACAGEHRSHGLNGIGKIDQHPIARRNAMLLQQTRKLGCCHLQFGECDFGRGLCDRAFIDKRSLASMTRFHMAVDTIEAGIDLAASEPLR